MFSFEEKQELLHSFPNIKLCYDTVNHNKVNNTIINNIDNEHICNDKIYLAIPCGKKCFVWFTHYKNKNVCLVLDLIDNKIINDIKIYNCVFNNELVYGEYGTIIYGTLFHYSHNKSLNNFFSIEDVFYCKGKSLVTSRCNNWLTKINILADVLQYDIKQIAYNNKYLVFGLPLLSRDIEDLKQLINDVKYKIYCVQVHLLNKTNIMSSCLYKNIDSILALKSEAVLKPRYVESVQHPPVQQQLLQHKPLQESQVPQHIQETAKRQLPLTLQKTKMRFVFNVKPDIQNDIYHLFCLDNNVETFYNVAYIPDYKTSVMMNKLFRNIKENENLDLLEESDDEEEFQNENVDRFVDLNKSTLMVCLYNNKFKKWYPIKVIDGAATNIIDKNELLKHEKDYQDKKYYKTQKENYNRNQKYMKKN